MLKALLARLFAKKVAKAGENQSGYAIYIYEWRGEYWRGTSRFLSLWYRA